MHAQDQIEHPTTEFRSGRSPDSYLFFASGVHSKHLSYVHPLAIKGLLSQGFLEFAGS